MNNFEWSWLISEFSDDKYSKTSIIQTPMSGFWLFLNELRFTAQSTHYGHIELVSLPKHTFPEQA